MKDGIKPALRKALIRILKPLIHSLFEVGFSASEFVDIVKVIYIDTARARLQHTGSHRRSKRQRHTKPSQLAISSLTGVGRPFIRAYLNGTWRLDDPDKTGGPRPARVIDVWWNDPKWQTPAGRPAKLPITGLGRTFQTLCKESSGEERAHNPILTELLRVGTVRVGPDRRVELLSQTYATVQWSALSIDQMGESVGSHIETWFYNFDNPDTALFCSNAVSENVKPHAEGVLRNQLRLQLDSTITYARRLLHSPRHSVAVDLTNEVGNALGVHCFMTRRENVKAHSAATNDAPEVDPAGLVMPKQKRKLRKSRAQ